MEFDAEFFDSSNNKNRFIKTKELLDDVSPSMCLAKWNQVTLHLATGTTHSCHHPAPHKIPLVELQKNHSALHNTSFKKAQRKKMLEGERPAECDYCWRAEDSEKNGGVTYSDRITKSAESWALPDIDRVRSLSWDADIIPSYLEVDFDTTCNFKCAYCTPSYSTTWMQEIKQHGPIEIAGGAIHGLDYLKNIDMMPILAREENPYIEAFWKWWPDVVANLKTFRITGGEPLLSKNTFKVLDYLIENPQPDLEFNINSNLGVPDEVISLFVEKMRIIQEKKAIKMFKLYTSNEAHDKHAEFVRFGLNYDNWLNNCNIILREIPDSHLTIMAAFNVFSVLSFKQFMNDVIELKMKYTKQPERKHPVSLDTPYVRWPEFLAPWILPKEFLQNIEECVSHAYKNPQVLYWPPLCGNGFFDYEINRIERLFYVVRDEMDTLEHNQEKLNLLRAQFYDYIIEYDKRRKTNFLETFPEYENFFYLCKLQSEHYHRIKNANT